MLHELIRYAQTTGLDSEPGFKPKWVRWLIVFDTEGQLLQIDDLTFGDKKSKGREFPKAPDLTFSQLISNGLRHYLVDSLDKVVLLTKEEVNDRDRLQHQRYVSLLEQSSSELKQLSPIAKSLQDEAILERLRSEFSEKKAKPTDMATIAVYAEDRQTIFVEQETWHDWWRNFLRTLGSTESVVDSEDTKPTKRAKKSVTKTQMRCFISGELVEPTATWNKISGLSDVGGLSMGDVIASFDKEAFGHYGFQQGENAAVGETQVKTIADAFNRLVQKSVRLGNSKVLYWYSRPVDLDPIEDLFGGSIEVDPNEEFGASTGQQREVAELSAKKLLRSIQSGEREELKDCRFFALTISANSGRVVVRDWMEGRFEDLVGRVVDWFDHLSIAHRSGKDPIKRHKFISVLAGCVRELKDISSSLETALWRSALLGHSIPNVIAAQVLNRIRIDIIQDESPRHARLGLLRAFCIRNERLDSMTVELDESVTSPAYLCGRLMAVLGAIQEAALGDVGAGVVQRYYAAASATPALVLGRLHRTAQVAHLPAIGKDESKKNLRRYFEDQLTELWCKMNTAPPATLSLEEQTLFAMGYYQQRAARFKGKEKDDSKPK